jgi:curved DNA-binding protein CbpA
MRDPYEILGLDASATADAIREAFRARAFETHPDRNPGDDGARARFEEVVAANAILSDDAKRAAWDRGERPGDEGAAGDAAGEPTEAEADVAAAVQFVRDSLPEAVAAVQAVWTGEPVRVVAGRAATNARRTFVDLAKTPEGQVKIRQGARGALDLFVALTRPP